MKIRRLAILVFLLCIFAIYASAETVSSEVNERFGVEGLWNALDKDAKKLLQNTDPMKVSDFSDSLFFILRNCADKMADHVRNDLSAVIRLFFTIVLCSLIESFSGHYGKMAASYAGALGTMMICVKEIESMVYIGEDIIMQLYEFTTALNPVMAAASAASGSMASAGVNYGLTVFFSNVLLKICMTIVVPGVYAYLALAFTDCLLKEDRLKPLRYLVGWSIEWLLKGIVYIFTGCLAVTGVLSGAADAAKLKAAKTAISTMIPIVGGIISGAAETVLTGASVLKSTVGTFGLLAVLAIMLLPFIRLFLKWILLKLVAALGGVLCNPVNGLLDAVSKGMGYLLAMTGAGTVICLLSCCCYLKVVHL